MKLKYGILLTSLLLIFQGCEDKKESSNQNISNIE